MFKRIIVGIDGSPSSITASEYAFTLGAFYDVPVVGIYVLDVRLLEEGFLADLAGILGFTFYEGISTKVREFLEKQGDSILKDFSALGRERGIKVSVVQTTGVPYKEIASQADREDLIIVGRKGRRPVRGVLLGSNSERVVKYAKCPVFLVPEKKRNLRKALVAYDGSESAKLSLKVCTSLKPLFNYELHVLYVEGGQNPRVIESEVSSLAGDEDFTFLSLPGFPEERITELVRAKDIDILFMGAYRKGRVRELFLGSITSFVIHTIDVPMILAKGYS